MAEGIVLYDFLQVRGGGERVSLTLARSLGPSRLRVGWRDRRAFADDALAGIDLEVLGGEPRTALGRVVGTARRFARRSDSLARYDWALYSGSYAPLAVHSRPDGRNVLYCYTVPRFLYDLRQFYLDSAAPWQRPALRLLAAWLKPRYEAAVRSMDSVVSISENVRRRVRHFLGRESVVVHPPCDVDRFRWRQPRGYYLSTARLEPYKRVDLVVAAFRHLPDRRLVVASGGSELVRLRKLARGAPNIEIAGWLTDDEMRKLMGRAIATIYLPKDEDFGISPVESMAAGKPVIGVAEGGLLETVQDGRTGVLLRPEPTVRALVAAVEEMTVERASSMRSACERNAARFNPDIFLAKMSALVREPA